jgi:hypothetical protein
MWDPVCLLASATKAHIDLESSGFVEWGSYGHYNISMPLFYTAKLVKRHFIKIVLQKQAKSKILLFLKLSIHKATE